MKFGILNIYCSLCGVRLKINDSCKEYHTKHFGYVCSKECFDLSEVKYARMILGKNDSDI